MQMYSPGERIISSASSLGPTIFPRSDGYSCFLLAGYLEWKKRGLFSSQKGVDVGFPFTQSDHAVRKTAIWGQEDQDHEAFFPPLLSMDRPAPFLTVKSIGIPSQQAGLVSRSGYPL